MSCYHCHGTVPNCPNTRVEADAVELSAKLERMTGERDTALGKAADAEKKAATEEDRWRETVIKAREARDCADLQVGELLVALRHLKDCGACGEGSLETCQGGRDALAAMAKAEARPTEKRVNPASLEIDHQSGVCDEKTCMYCKAFRSQER